MSATSWAMAARGLPASIDQLPNWSFILVGRFWLIDPDLYHTWTCLLNDYVTGIFLVLRASRQCSNLGSIPGLEHTRTLGREYRGSKISEPISSDSMPLRPGS